MRLAVSLRRRRRVAYWTPPCAMAASASLLHAFPGLIAGSASYAYAFATTVTATGFVSLFYLATGKFHGRHSFTNLVLQATLLVLVFATIHHAFGMNPPAGSAAAAAPVDFATSLYFSIVTWTTLGYGDVTAAPPLRLLAGMEAAVGYVYFGLIVGLAANFFNASAKQRGRSEDD